MADVLDIDNAEDFEVDDDGDRKSKIFTVFIAYSKIFQRELCV